MSIYVMGVDYAEEDALKPWRFFYHSKMGMIE